MTVKVDSSAHFLEVDDSNTIQVVKQKLTDAMYELDEIKLKEIDVTRRNV